MKVRTRRPSTLIAGGLAAVLLTACSSQGSESRMVVGMSDDILATDPASGYDPGSWLLFNNVFQSLLSFPPGASTPVPEAAKECEFSDGSRTYTCTLRDGLKFSNGNRLTSADVKYSFDRTIRINDPAGPAPLLSTISSIRTPDDKTVVFRLKVPDATFPSKIASGGGSIVDRRVYPEDRLLQGGKAVGSGPYRLNSIDKGKAVFSVYPGYHGTAEVKNSGVTLKLFRGDQQALRSALEKGDVDIAYRGLSAKAIAALDTSSTAEEGGIEVIQGNSAEVQHMVFNVDDPVVGKLAVRKAIAHLVDRYSLVSEVYQSTAEPLYSVIPVGITGHGTSFFDTYGDSPKPKQAKAELRDAGIADKVKLTLWSTPSRYGPATDDELQTIADQLNRSGLFDARMKSVAFDEYEKGIADGKYGVYVKGWVPDYPDPDNFTQPFFGEGNVLSNNYDNEEIVDRIIPRTSSMTDRASTRQEYMKLQGIVAQQLPILPLWQGKQYAVAHENVRGLQNCLDSSTVFRFWELSTAY
ncbi:MULTISPECIES: ABC transporter substrate-binding protein [unclassified Streptomyces]|uniref:ABC transporter substrate-binding protein n=1 Tax=unclassified Streptomyces TaxID=2593676 RepID=UPI00225BEBBA|nr:MULTISPECIES: ABC transporter substrate-binding protein [unclassified Streptomyces]MCX5140344.1 ABC transporter substrate-binding protein [Streptomyces sp. NBC_00338]WSU63742.1 ABC transporter substrate-binding protein [Streptomyces sp. NBC_01104]